MNELMKTLTVLLVMLAVTHASHMSQYTGIYGDAEMEGHLANGHRVSIDEDQVDFDVRGATAAKCKACSNGGTLSSEGKCACPKYVKGVCCERKGHPPRGCRFCKSVGKVTSDGQCSCPASRPKKYRGNCCPSTNKPGRPSGGKVCKTCKNGGRLVKNKCRCPAGMYGRCCQLKQSDIYCKSCQNGGTMVDKKCTCPKDVYGLCCQRKKLHRYCKSCQNGGTMVDKKCTCPKGVYGPCCQRKKQAKPETPEDAGKEAQ